MPGIRVTFEFGSQDYAWSEAYVNLQTGLTPNFAAAFAAAQGLANYRVPLLGNGAQLNRIRLSEYPANRLVDDILPPNIPTQPTWPPDLILGGYLSGLQYTASRPWSALLVQADDGGGRTKQIYLAGCPCGLFQQETADEQGIYWAGVPGFSTRMSEFTTALANGQWGWVSQRNEAFSSVVTGPGAPYGLVTNAQFPGLVGVQVPAQLVFSDPLHPKVRVKGYRRQNVRLAGPNGLWSVAGVLAPVAPATAWTYFLQNSGQVSLTGPYTGAGQVAAFLPAFSQIVNARAVATVHRKRGASLSGVRGKSRIHA